jgi:hypothetical protein
MKICQNLVQIADPVLAKVVTAERGLPFLVA